MWLVVLLLSIPVIEIALFVQVGGLIGAGPVVALVLLAGLAGVALVRRHGPQTLATVQAALRRGEDPGEPILHAALLLVAAGLFVTPGFLTDAVALLLLLPVVRRAIYRRLRLRVATRAAGTQRRAETVIDGVFEDVTPPPRPTHPPSGWTRH